MNVFRPHFNEKTYVILAVSGGPDSMAMLDLFKDEKYQIVVALVNYKKREESDKEQENVKLYCEKNNLIFETKTVREKAVGNFQDWARNYRYDFFKELYLKYNAKALYVAHNLDDYLETYYIQKERRTNTRFYGIAQESFINEMRVIRPCLNVLKNDLLEYCMENKIYYSIDCSNLTDDFLRNRIRHHILGKMSNEEKYDLKQKIELENEKLKEKFTLVDQMYDKYIQGNDISFELFKENDNIIECVLFKLINKKNFSIKAIKDIVRQVKGSKSNLIIPLDKERSLVKEYDKVSIQKNDSPDYYLYTLNRPREFDCKYFSVYKVGDGKHQLKLKKEDFPLTIRPYFEDDYIELENGKKKISRVFIDNKIGVSKRKIWPVVINAQGLILLVCGLTKHYNYSKSRENFDSEIYIYEKVNND